MVASSERIKRQPVTRRRTPVEVPAGSELLRPRPAAAFLGVGATHFWQLRRQDPTFPRPVRLGIRAIGFRRSDLIAWLETRQAAR